MSAWRNFHNDPLSYNCFHIFLHYNLNSYLFLAVRLPRYSFYYLCRGIKGNDAPVWFLPQSILLLTNFSFFFLNFSSLCWSLEGKSCSHVIMVRNQSIPLFFKTTKFNARSFFSFYLIFIFRFMISISFPKSFPISVPIWIYTHHPPHWNTNSVKFAYMIIFSLVLFNTIKIRKNIY